MADALYKEFEAVNAEFMAAYDAQDPERVAKVYSEDCTLMTPTNPPAKGRKEVAAAFESVMKKGAVKIKVEVEELGPLGASDICFERTRYTFLKANGDVLTDGRYLVVWKKVNGSWLAYNDCLCPLHLPQ